MTQQLLHSSEVGATFQKVGGERMSQGVGERAEPMFHDATHATGTKRSPTLPYPQLVVGGAVDHHGTRLGQISVDRVASRSAQRHGSFLAALAHHSYEVVALQISDRKARQFRNAQPGRIEQLEECPIAQGERVVTVDGGVTKRAAL